MARFCNSYIGFVKNCGTLAGLLRYTPRGVQGHIFALVCAGAFMLVDCGGKSQEVLDRRRDGDGGATFRNGGAAGESGCADCASGGASGDAGDSPAGAPATDEGGRAGEPSNGGAPAGAPNVAGHGAEPGSGGERAGEAGSGTSGVGSGGEGVSGEGSSGEGSNPPASVAISSIRAYQAVEVALVDGGAPVTTRNAPLIAGRRVMFRVFVTAAEDIVGHELVGELFLERPGNEPERLESRVTLGSASVPGKLDSTLVFQVDADDVTTDLEWSLSLSETDGDAIAQYPAEGTEPFGATAAGGVLEVTLVPMVANGFTPDLSPAALERYLEYARAAFPVPDVLATVRDAVTLEFPVDGEGAGLGEALDRLYEVREADAPPDNVYYYGVLTPSATFDEYCASGCTVGLASVASANQVYYRGGIGTGFFESAVDTNSQETLVHELGHAMGRQHSPCGTDDSSFFPYADGSIGVWGYDGSALRNPSRFMDVMGYCLPVWISDYTYQALFTRISHVNATAAPRRFGHAEKRRYRRLIVGHDGALRWGSESEVTKAETATSIELALSTSGSAQTESVRVEFAPFDHLPGGFALVPAELLVPGVRVAVGGAAIDAP